MKATRRGMMLSVALSVMACGGGTELTATLSSAAVRPKRFTAALSGAAERPNSVQTSARGSVLVSLEGRSLKVVSGEFSDLTANATAAHIHSPADENGTAAVLCSLVLPAATAGTLSEGTGPGSCGALLLTDADVANLESGKMYVNIHTPNNPSGEIRGQLRLKPPGAGTGSAKVTVAGKKLKVSGSFAEMEYNAAEAHIHGPADENSTGGILCTLAVPAALSGEFQAGQGAGSCGALELSEEGVANFEAGRMYIDIHTQFNLAGEIRGQLSME